MTKQTIKQQILDALKNKPMDSNAIAALIGMTPTNASKRLYGLHKEGEINKFGMVRTKNGHDLIVWGIGDSHSELKNKSNDLTARITTALDDGDMTINQMAEKCRTSRYKAVNACKRLIKSGEVIKVRTNTGPMPAAYGLKGRERKATKSSGLDTVAAKAFRLYEPKEGEIVWNGVRC